MRSPADASALAVLQALLADMTDTLEETLAHARRAPAKWRRWSTARQLWFLRKRAKLTQAELARRCGTTQSHVARLERGLDARLGTVRMILKGLGYGLLVLPYPLEGEDKEVFGTEERRGRSKSASPAAS